MNNNSTRKQPSKVDSHKEGIKIVKIAAFCFAIISFIATAQGLHDYVFVDYYWQALLISFGIQSILFVFNLQLPEYFNQIGKLTPDINRTHKKYHFGDHKGTDKKSFKMTSLQKLIVFFYVVIIFASSFFSFVYITNFVYRDTQYIDANIVVDRTYRMYLSDTEKYIDELTKVKQLTINKKLSELSEKAPNNTGDLSKTKSELVKNVTKAQNEYNNCVAIETDAKNVYKEAESIYNSPWWRNRGQIKKEHDNMIAAREALNTATQNKTKAKNNLNDAKQALKEYKPSVKITADNLLVEILKKNPQEKELNSLMSELNEAVFQLKDSNAADFSFSGLVEKMQELSVAVNNYLTLRDIKFGEKGIDKLKEDFSKDDIVIPDYTSEEFDKQKSNWESEWKSLFTSLDQIIKSVPEYLKTDIIDSSIINATVLQK